MYVGRRWVLRCESAAGFCDGSDWGQVIAGKAGPAAASLGPAALVYRQLRATARACSVGWPCGHV